MLVMRWGWEVRVVVVEVVETVWGGGVVGWREENEEV